MTGNVILPKFDNYILLNKFGLCLLGVWPIPEDSARWKFTLKKIHVSLVYLLLLSLLVPQLLDLYILWGDVDANVENLCTSLTTFTVIAKLTNIVFSRGVFQKSLANMRQNWEAVMRQENCPEEREILLKMAKVGFVFTRNYCIIMYVTAGMYFLRPLVVGSGTKSSHAREYPFCAWYYYDQFSNLTYATLYLSQVIIGFCCGTGNFTLDSLCLVMVYHACAQLRILQRQISKLTNDSSDDAVIANRVRQLVKLHEKNIENARNLEAVFSGASAQQLLVSCVIICVIGLKLIVSLNDAFQLIMYVAYMQLVIFQIYLYCSPGDELINQYAGNSGCSLVEVTNCRETGPRRAASHTCSTKTQLHLRPTESTYKPPHAYLSSWRSMEIGRAAYMASWTNFPKYAAHSLLMMTIRSQRPLKITAGRFYVMSIPNFTSILKTSASYLSVLRVLYD